MYHEEIPVGQVRLEIKNNNAIICYSIDRNFRGRGYGEKILDLLEKEIKIHMPFINKLIGDVKYENIPFTEITSEYLKVSADYMYLDKEEKKDLFETMLNNNYIVFNFYGLDGQLYKIGYPLLWFKDKIEELK